MLAKLVSLLRREGRVIDLNDFDRIVVVGDTHGDWEASEQIVGEYLGARTAIVFLGDYVDRGGYENSKRNLDFLLSAKLSHPDRLFLLMGNHECYFVAPFAPADFWEALPQREARSYASVLALLPFAAYHRDYLMVHAALPKLTLPELADVGLGSEAWQILVWGDWVETSGDLLGYDPLTGRPKLGRRWFGLAMRKVGFRKLLRSHDPSAPTFLYGGKCITLFTSKFYGRRELGILEKGRFRLEKL